METRLVESTPNKTSIRGSKDDGRAGNKRPPRPPRPPPPSLQPPHPDVAVALGIAICICYESSALDVAEVAEDGAEVLRTFMSKMIAEDKNQEGIMMSKGSQGGVTEALIDSKTTYTMERAWPAPAGRHVLGTFSFSMYLPFSLS